LHVVVLPRQILSFEKDEGTGIQRQGSKRGRTLLSQRVVIAVKIPANLEKPGFAGLLFVFAALSLLNAFARAILPELQEFYSHEENQKAFEKWKAKQRKSDRKK
jgi:hypothetical protein